MIKVLVNALTVKKKAGGVFQVSINFINETLHRDNIQWSYIVSKDIDNRISNKIKEKLNVSYFVFPTQPDFLHSYYETKKEVKDIEDAINPDIVYSLAAPSYFSFRAVEVMRFTNPWVTHPNKYALKKLNISNNIFNYLYCLNQKRLIKKCKYFITQSNTAKDGILKITNLSQENVEVISNVLPAFFDSLNTQKNESSSDLINVACISVPHPNKDIEIVPLVIKILKEKYGITNIKFNLTIPFDHPFISKFSKLVEKYDVSKQIHNWGYCTQQQLVDLYSNCSLFFLPTLLETFSASLLEAMYFNLGIVTTDLIFNKEVCLDSALYYSPGNAEKAAEKLSILILDDKIRLNLTENISNRLVNYSDYSLHMARIENFFNRIVVENNNKI